MHKLMTSYTAYIGKLENMSSLHYDEYRHTPLISSCARSAPTAITEIDRVRLPNGKKTQFDARYNCIDTSTEKKRRVVS